ncbi:hypothetical protein BS78_07G026500 [Paspalum vaginatum]|nr:hypothetical protein BS78_07G026500 [Paspalum vaginatum]
MHLLPNASLFQQGNEAVHACDSLSGFGSGSRCGSGSGSVHAITHRVTGQTCINIRVPQSSPSISLHNELSTFQFYLHTFRSLLSPRQRRPATSSPPAPTTCRHPSCAKARSASISTSFTTSARAGGHGEHSEECKCGGRLRPPASAPAGAACDRRQLVRRAGTADEAFFNRATCALAACIVCVEAVHRFEFEKVHQGQRTFPYTLMPDAAFWELFTKCRGDGTWVQGRGANVCRVLTKIQEMGGVPARTTTDVSAAPAAQRTLLPLSWWQEHRWNGGAGLSPEHVAALLDSHGPCVGVLWVVLPKYAGVVASGDGNQLVYRECIGRLDARARQESNSSRGGWHAVVCFAYRFYGEEMHVLVLDNHEVTGPHRWIHVDELVRLYTLSVVV